MSRGKKGKEESQNTHSNEIIQNKNAKGNEEISNILKGEIEDKNIGQIKIKKHKKNSEFHTNEHCILEAPNSQNGLRPLVLEEKKRILLNIILGINFNNKKLIKSFFNNLTPRDTAFFISFLTREQIDKLLDDVELGYDAISILPKEIRMYVLTKMDQKNIVSDVVRIKSIEEGEVQDILSQTIVAIEEKSEQRLIDIFQSLNPGDAASIVEFLPAKHRYTLIKMLGSNFNAEILKFIDTSIIPQIVNKIDSRVLAIYLSNLDEVDSVYVLEQSNPKHRLLTLTSLARLISKESIRFIKRSLQYEEESAGRLMSPVMSLPPSCTIHSAYRKYCFYTRHNDKTQVIYICDNDANKCDVLGKMYLSDLCKLNQKHKTREHFLSKHMINVPCVITVDTKFDEIVFLIKKYGAIDIPVLSRNGRRLVGVIGPEQVIEILDISETEQILTLGQLAEFDFYESIANTIWIRMKLLGFGSLACFCSVCIIIMFEEVMRANIALTMCAPLVAGIGGNATSQVLTVSVRALSNREIAPGNIRRVILKEVCSGFGSGLFIGFVISIILFAFKRSYSLSLIVWASVAANVTWAAFIGCGLPIFIDRVMKRDPAMASLILNVMTDMVGYIILLSLARYVYMF